MAKVISQKPVLKIVHKRRSEDEMRKALARDDEESAFVLGDCIDELLEARQLIEEMKMFAGQWLVKLTIRK